MSSVLSQHFRPTGGDAFGAASAMAVGRKLPEPRRMSWLTVNIFAKFISIGVRRLVPYTPS
jgi:hypothetical protein